MSRFIRSFPLVAVCAAAPVLAQSQQGTTSATPAAARAPLAESDYGRIETLGASALSPDGKWIAYEVHRGASGGELRYRAIASDAEKTARNGTSPVFTSNNRWLIYTVTPDSSEGGRGARGGGGRGGGRGGAGTGGGDAAGANRNRVAIIELATGATTIRDEVQSFAVNRTGSHVALRRYAAAGAPIW